MPGRRVRRAGPAATTSRVGEVGGTLAPRRPKTVTMTTASARLYATFAKNNRAIEISYPFCATA